MRSLLILFLLAICLAPELLMAQSETLADQTTSSETEAAHELQAEPAAGGSEREGRGTISSAQEDQERKLRKQKLEIGLILTSAIVMAGVFLVVLTLLYGRRTKRQLAAGRGPSAPRDDLWYLKKSQESSSANGADAEPEGDSE